MRVTEFSIINDFLRTTSRSRERIAQLNLQLGTQQRINKISDDPAGAAQVIRYNSLLSKIDHYSQTIVKVRSSLQMAGSALGSVADILQEAKAVVQGAGAEPGTMRALAAQMDQMTQTALDLAATRFGDRYLFSGSQTRTTPFSLAGTPPTAIYNGNVQPLRYQVGDGMMQTVGLNGLEAFGSTSELSLSGDLDPSAAAGTTMVITVNVQDGLGGAHTVELTLEKTGSDSWSLSAALPAGTTDATLRGGTATIRFDPATGALQSLEEGETMVLTPLGVSASGETAPPVSVNIRAETLTQTGSGAPGPSGSSRLMSVFDKMLEIRDALRAGTTPSSEDFQTLELMQRTVQEQEAKTGAIVQLLDAADSHLSRQQETLLTLRGEKQDVDVAEIGIRLKYEETMLEAALSAAAQILPKSLMDFLR
jgi:flagellar hook-associated protein 3